MSKKLTEFSPERIRRIREKNHVSQPVFAMMLNISESTVQKWESGNKHPKGIALKVLHVVEEKVLKPSPNKSMKRPANGSMKPDRAHI